MAKPQKRNVSQDVLQLLVSDHIERQKSMQAKHLANLRLVGKLDDGMATNSDLKQLHAITGVSMQQLRSTNHENRMEAREGDRGI